MVTDLSKEERERLLDNIFGENICHCYECETARSEIDMYGFLLLHSPKKRSELPEGQLIDASGFGSFLSFILPGLSKLR